MLRIEVTHTFDVSVAEAFAYITDMKNRPEYSIGRLSDDPSSTPCEGRCRTSIDVLTSEEQERESRGSGGALIRRGS